MVDADCRPAHRRVRLGARKSELLALQWSDVDFDRGRIRVERQLLAGGAAPVIGPPKSQSRTVTLAAGTIERLRDQKRSQAALKLKNLYSVRQRRLHLLDGVSRPPAAEGPTRPPTAERILGRPLRAAADSRRVAEGADLSRAPAHQRHGRPCGGVAPHVVAQRLGHSNPGITLNIYAHATADLQEAAAAVMGRAFHG